MGIIGKPPAPNSVKTMKKLGIDISHQKSAGITTEDIKWADFILVMAPKHAKKLRGKYPKAEDKILILANFGGMVQIDDPIGKWIFSFHACRKSIHKSLRGFAKQIAIRNSSQ
jgi:protein-tyrosine-phosphatase